MMTVSLSAIQEKKDNTPFPYNGGSQPPPKTPIAIISGTSKATDFNFGRYGLHLRGPSEKSGPLTFLCVMLFYI